MEKISCKKLKENNFKNVPAARSNIMRAVKSKSNKSTELKFCEALVESNIQGWRIHEKIDGTPDIFFPVYRIAIFLDGCFWHVCPKCGHIPKVNYEYWKTKLENNIQRDVKKEDILKKQGYEVLRFWEHEIAEDVLGCISILEECIEESLIRLSEIVFYQ